MVKSKIESLGLQTRAIEIFKKCDRTLRPAAKMLSKEVGEEISYSALKRFIDKIKDDVEYLPPETEKKNKLAKKNILHDEKETIKFTSMSAQDMIDTYKKIRDDPNTTLDKLVEYNDKIFKTGSMNRLLNHHNIGVKGPEVQFNQVIFNDRVREMFQIVREETDLEQYERIKQRLGVLAKGA